MLQLTFPAGPSYSVASKYPAKPCIVESAEYGSNRHTAYRELSITGSRFGCTNVNTRSGGANNAHRWSFTTYGVSMCAKSPCALASFQSFAHVIGAK